MSPSDVQSHRWVALPLRWKLFLAFLAAIAVVLLTVSVSFLFISQRVIYGHMGGMMSMMTDTANDVEDAVAAGVTQAVLFGGLLAGAVAILSSYWVSFWITRPLKDMSQVARRIASGRYDQRVSYDSPDHIGDFSRAFNEMAATLEKTEQVRTELLATISHELRTPLANIQGYMDGLLDGIIPSEPETFQLVREETHRLHRLVGDIASLSRLESRIEAIHPQCVDASQLSANAVENMRPQFDEKAVRLVLRNEGQAEVWADPDKVMQVLVNLLSNALKYTPSGGAVQLSLEKHDDAVQFQLSDTGVGIPAEDVPHVFERFYRVDKSRSSSSGGAGIGLAVAKSLVEQMGGRIWVESEVSRGSIFSFELPSRPS